MNKIKLRLKINKIDIFICVVVSICLFVSIGFLCFNLEHFAYLNHQEYRTCKLTENNCNEDFDCSYFGEKSYDIYSNHKIDSSNVTSKFDICREPGSVIYETQFKNGIEIFSCSKDGKYNYIIHNYNNEKFNLTIKTIDVPHFRNINTGEIYIVKNKTFDLILGVHEIVQLEYYPSMLVVNPSINPLDKFKSVGNFTIYFNSSKIEIPQEFFYALENRTGCFYYNDYKICNEDKKIKIIDFTPKWMGNVFESDLPLSYSEYYKMIIEEFSIGTKTDIYYCGKNWAKNEIGVVCDLEKPELISNFTIVWNVPCLFYNGDYLFVQPHCNQTCVEECGLDNDSCLSKCSLI